MLGDIWLGYTGLLIDSVAAQTGNLQLSIRERLGHTRSTAMSLLTHQQALLMIFCRDLTGSHRHLNGPRAPLVPGLLAQLQST